MRPAPRMGAAPGAPDARVVRPGADVVSTDLALPVAELLRDRRRAAGLTQEELAQRAGVSPRSISELERGGAHIPRRDTVALVVRALGLTGSDAQEFQARVDRRRRAGLRAASHSAA